MLETWLALSAGALLVAAAVARAVALSGMGLSPRRWDLLVLGLRAAAVASLAAALGLGLAGREPSIPLTLALAALILQLALWWRYRFDGAGPAVDLMAVALVAFGFVANWPAWQAWTCARYTIASQLQEGLFLAGAGGATVMGGSGLVLALHAALLRRGRDLVLPSQAGLADLTKAATTLTLVLLGGGLLVGLWWTWRTLGRLVGDDPRWGWMAVAWLLAATSGLAWRLARRGGYWAAALAVLAAVAANSGMLAAAQLQQWFGF
jgi:hypothetical protein